MSASAWLRTTLGSLCAFGSGALMAAGPGSGTELPASADPAAGQPIFTQCLACHTARPGEPHRIGPNLWGVLGRPVASGTGFDYSEALQSLGGNWDVGALDGFLYAPASHAPGTKMVYPGIKDDVQRINLIAYLHTLSDEPPALPAQAAGDGGTDAFGNTWPAGPGRDLTGFTCNACHSLEIVKQQGLSRESWDDLLDWMVNKQGMAEPGSAQRALILNYLSTHFGIGGAAMASAPNDQFGNDWPVGPGRDITGYTCSACHSLAIVKQQGLSRESWDELLDWMVEEQGMGEPDPEQRKEILGYLATHFGIGGRYSGH